MSTSPPRPARRRHRAATAATATAALALALAGCSPTPSATVVAADGVLCDLTQRLADADLRVRCLLEPGDDPHQFRLTPRQRRDLSQARLVLINGYGLTPALERLPGALAVAERAVPLSPELDQHPSGQGGGALVHPHGGRDPHVWHDPSQAMAMVQLVAQQLQRLQPTAARPIAARATAMATVLTQLDHWNRRQFATVAHSSPLATGHRAFASLARAYGLRELPLVDAMSGSTTLRPQAFQAVVERLRQDQVGMLFSEQRPAARSLQRLSSLSGVPLAPAPLVADGLAKDSAGSGRRGQLVATLSANTCLIVEGLGGRCDRRGQRALVQAWDRIR